jgi:hypothetical protein
MFGEDDRILSRGLTEFAHHDRYQVLTGRTGFGPIRADPQFPVFAARQLD